MIMYSKKIKVKNYLFAGLDFIFDEEENPWFLEANSTPQGIGDYINITNQKIVSKLAKLFEKKGKNVCFLVNKFIDNSYDNPKWLYALLNKKTRK